MSNLKGYQSIFYDENITNGEKEKTVLLRHDIDLSIPSALEIALIEHSFSFKSTFFINIHSDFYNVFEKKSILTLKKIIDLNHSIGIHFDSTYWDIENETELEKKLLLEKTIIKDFLGVEPKSFSFHNPTKEILLYDRDTYAGLKNAYSNDIKKTYKYCSDSNGYWRHENMFDVVIKGNYNDLHLLTHPGWWRNDAIKPREKVYQIIKARGEDVLKDYDKILEINDRGNISDVYSLIKATKKITENVFYEIDRLMNEKNYLQLYKKIHDLLCRYLDALAYDKMEITKDRFENLEYDKKDLLKKIADISNSNRLSKLKPIIVKFSNADGILFWEEEKQRNHIKVGLEALQVLISED
ncbi:MAG: hypothetical protein ACON47_09810 [Flavobacteriaceae bacterium]